MSRVLLVDDDDQVRSLFVLALSNDGHTVTETASGAEALDLLTRETFDILVTDLIMPDTEGMEIIMKVRMQSLPIKIIAVSGGGSAGGSTYLDTAKRLGADLALKKPVPGSRLIEVVRVLTAGQA